MNDVDSAIPRYHDLHCRRIWCSYQKYSLPSSITKQKQTIATFTLVFLYMNSSSKCQPSSCVCYFEGALLYTFIFKKNFDKVYL